MSKLRELIAKSTPGPWECIGKGGVALWRAGELAIIQCAAVRQQHNPAHSDAELIAYMHNNAEAIADLIDAARECSIMQTGSTDECVANLHKLDAALTKLKDL
jgi:hypothetical protein